MDLMEFDMAISYVDSIPYDIIREFTDHLTSAGIAVKSEKRDAKREVFAGLKLILSAGILVFISQKYFGTILQEAAKDHYPAIKRGLRQLLNRVAGPNREVNTYYVTSPSGKAKERNPPILSVCSTLKDGRPIRFIFQGYSHQDILNNSLEQMFALLEYTNLRLDNEGQEQHHSDFRTLGRRIYLRFDEETSEWELVIPLKK
jgi:hypothetical protein